MRKQKRKKDEFKTIARGKRYPLIIAVVVAFSCVMSGAVSTFAWFQAEARVRIETATPQSATISVSAPEGAKFYYFVGNGIPGGDYTGYSRSDSVIGKAPRTYATSSCGVTWSDFVQIDISDVTTTTSGVASAKNCFNFSKMRPGCFYTFCAQYASTSTGIKLTFAQGTTGDGKTPKRRIYSGGTTTRPLSLAMAMNGYAVASTNSDANAASFIETSFTKGADKTDDKINYDHTSASPSLAFTFLSGVNTTNASYTHMYFTIYMGTNTKTDALLFNSKSGTGSSEILYYQPDNTSGDYSALEGLSLSLSKVEALV